MLRMLLIPILTLFSWSVIADPAAELDTLIEEHWSWYLDEHPETRTYLGDHTANDRWNDVSLEGHFERDARRGEFLRRLETIDTASLAPEQLLNHRMLNSRLESRREAHRLGLHLLDFSMREGPQTKYDTIESARFETASDYRMWLARLQAIPTLLDQYRELMEEGIVVERVQAREVMQRVPAQLDKLITDNVEGNPFYRPFLEMPAGIDARTAAQLRERARGTIANQVVPAYKQFKAFFVSSYLPATREHPGVSTLPGGEEIYRFLARDFTTTSMTPEQIHETGVAEVARILTEMEDVKKEVGFTGDLAAFNHFLRTDPQFYYDSPEELFDAYLAVAKRIDPELVNLFGVLPRMPYGLRSIPAELAPDTTTAYYMEPAANGTRAGYYYVNLYRPEVRPKYEMEVLSVHEAVPGHHLQIALGQEIEGLPEFRRAASVTAFVEGWGLYSERLGYQLGLYKDPYSRYGQLTYDMWRAVRLVVDTGMHYFGWSRQEAIDYFKANAGKTETDIINEIDRYIGWPGQALAYKIGQLKILELRARAEQQLGERFNIRAFHDHLLGAGAIPLDALEERMSLWLATQ